MTTWNYRLVHHDLPNQDGEVYIHVTDYDDNQKVRGINVHPEVPRAVITDPDWYGDKQFDGGLDTMKWELDRLKEDIERNPEIIKYSDHVEKRITNPHEMTLDNALIYAREVWIGIYHDSDKEDVIWLNITDNQDLTLRFHNEIWSMSSTPRDELHPDIDFTLEDEGHHGAMKDVLRIKVAFSYLRGE